MRRTQPRPLTHRGRINRRGKCAFKLWLLREAGDRVEYRDGGWYPKPAARGGAAR